MDSCRTEEDTRRSKLRPGRTGKDCHLHPTQTGNRECHRRLHRDQTSGDISDEDQDTLQRGPAGVRNFLARKYPKAGRLCSLQPQQYVINCSTDIGRRQPGQRGCNFRPRTISLKFISHSGDDTRRTENRRDPITSAGLLFKGTKHDIGTFCGPYGWLPLARTILLWRFHPH